MLSLIRDVADGCLTTYTCDGSISDMDKAKSYLVNIGFTTDNKQSYSSSSVLQSLVNSRPVLIEGYNNEEIGHEWIIDGYCRNARLRREELSVYDTQLRRWVIIHTRDYYEYDLRYHYNWGGDGDFDGWFADGCFDHNSRLNGYTRSITPSSSYEYDVHILPNIHPNE